MAVNQVIYDGETLVDLTGDTVTPQTLASGAVAHDASGNPIVGLLPLVNILDIEHGGTNANTADEALANLGGMPRKTASNVITGNTTLSATHAEHIVPVISNSAVTITIPAGDALPIGTFITLTAFGTGTTTLSTASGVTLHTKDDKKTIDGQYAAVTLYKYDSTTWYGWGALA